MAISVSRKRSAARGDAAEPSAVSWRGLKKKTQQHSNLFICDNIMHVNKNHPFRQYAWDEKSRTTLSFNPSELQYICVHL